MIVCIHASNKSYYGDNYHADFVSSSEIYGIEQVGTHNPPSMNIPARANF